MSIFKETFQKYVSQQFRIREEILKLGNNPSVSRFGPRTTIELPEGNEKINIEAGAFYNNTVAKQCVIRMASGVDIIDEKIKSEFNLGDNASQNFILEGGILDEDGRPRGGFAKDKGAYGSKSTLSDGNDDFGIVPMPGIIDANIRTKTAYGSLREAQVNFVCHNRRQLELLELLYMRPGMPILLEWQWSPFINENGKIDNQIFSLINKGDERGKEDWFDSSKKLSDFNLEIVDNKKQSNGNYDGFVGFCKNFEFTARPDGGYDCTTELIAAGEVLESLKIRNDGFTIQKENQKLAIDNLQVILQGILELDALLSQATEPNEELASAAVVSTSEISPGAGFFGAALRVVDLSNFPVARQLLIETQDIDIGNSFKTNLGLDIITEDNSFEEDVTKPIQQYREDYDQYFIFDKEKIGSEKIFLGERKLLAPNTFIRWDYFVDLINQLCIPLTNPADSDSNLLTLTYQKPIRGNYNDLEYLEFIDYRIKSNSPLKKVPQTYTDKYYFIRDIENIDDIINNSFNPKVCLLPKQVFKYPPNSDNPLTATQDSKKIGHIMLNVEHLNDVYNKMAYDEDKPVENFSFYDYLNKIWQDVNNACAGRHRFTLQTEVERPDHVRIIDLQADSKIIKPEDLFELKIQSNKSIVRDFNFNSTIPNSVSATIAVAAQAPASINDLDAVTFANFTQGIKSRFTTEGELNRRDANDLKEKYDKDKNKYQDNILELASYLEKLMDGKLKGNESNVDGVSFSEAIGLAKQVENQIISLSKRDPLTGKRLPIIPESRSEVIPLKFNVSMDGISGIVIGNVFKVEKEKLPLGYQDEKIAFVVMGESQTITSGQDWITEFSGQIMLLDTEVEGVGPKVYGDTSDEDVAKNVEIANNRTEEEVVTQTDATTTQGNVVAQGSNLID